MAKFLGSGKSKGILGNLELEYRKRKSIAPKLFTIDLKKPLENIVDKNIMGYFDDSLEKSAFLTEEPKSNKNKFWMNILNPINRNYFSIVEKLKRKHKLAESSNAFLAITSLFITIIEYELAYYPMFVYNAPVPLNIPYSGDTYRILISCICGLMCFFSIQSCYYEFLIKREQKKIVNGINFIEISYFFP